MEVVLTFEHWFDIFHSCVERLGYTGPIDKESFEMDYEYGFSPEETANEFVKEMNE